MKWENVEEYKHCLAIFTELPISNFFLESILVMYAAYSPIFYPPVGSD